MYDSSISASSMNVQGMSFADSPLSIDDLAFIELMLVLADSDKALLDKMHSIRDTQNRKSAISEEMAKLNKILENAEEDGSDGWVTDEDKHQALLQERSEQAVQYQNEILSTADPVEILVGTYRQLSDDEIKELADKGNVLAKEEAANRGMYQIEETEDRLEELQREFEDLTQSSELMLIDLNRLMQKRSQAVQLTSNIMQSCNQTAMGIISNFK
ncbi:MAG: hypothetical protein JRF33_11345 [Deltaproteobacteria bacterium]|nr:hypothetical protein [Deltaproteobacteria bacterium]